MIIIGLISGLLSTMNIWAVKIDDVRLHLNDIYMAMLMTAWMILFESILHYNQTYIVGSIIAIIIIIYMIRNQVFISDEQYLSGMIPHHSMAILMSEKIKNKSSNPKLIKLANNIITSQNKEINIMNKLL